MPQTLLLSTRLVLPLQQMRVWSLWKHIYKFSGPLKEQGCVSPVNTASSCGHDPLDIEVEVTTGCGFFLADPRRTVDSV